MLALKKTAQMNLKYPLAAKTITEDDVLGSFDDSQIAIERIRQVEEVLEAGGFVMKQWVMSGDERCLNKKVLDVNHEKVLSLYWKPKEDVISFKIKLNFSRKTQQGRIEPDVSACELGMRLPSLLTKRIIFSQIGTLYDPLGFIIPFTLKAKLLMRDVVMEGSGNQQGGWDEPISEALCKRAKSQFKETILLEDLVFHRCVKPSTAVGHPELVIFCDGSNKTYGTVAYIRWELSDGSVSSHLLCSKNRIAPTRQLSMPRLELCGAVIASSVKSIVASEIRFKFQRIFHITDSSIVRTQIQKESFRFNPFAANRVAEIQSRTDPTEWYWVPSEDNLANLTTRECPLSELRPDSVWQRGSKVLHLDHDKWPLKQSFEEELPDTVLVKATMNVCEVQEAQSIIDIGRFSSYKKLLLVTARVLQVAKARSLKELCKEPSAECLQVAENYWIKQVQEPLFSDWEKEIQTTGTKT